MHFVECFNFANSCSMKYLPVVSTLQEWLDGKLGIQGIDAVSCAFYVLSLLQKNETEESETACQLPCSKVVDDHSLSYWPRNSWSDWAYSSVNNPLAAECASAPVQGYEIGHLGNDLNPSLKSIEEKDGDSRMQECFCGEGCFSLSVTDQAKCSPDDVFSIHDRSNEKCSVAPVTEHRNSFWTNETDCVGFLNHMLDGEGLKENNSFLMADKMIQEKADEIWKNDAAVLGDKNDLIYHEDKLLWSKKDSGSFFSWNTVEDSSRHVQNSYRQEKHAEDTPDMWELGIFCNKVKGEAPISSPQDETGIKYIAQRVSGNEEEDSNLAQLIAKFDHSVEAIWNLDSVGDSPDTISMQENIPWSLYSIESPPAKDFSKIEPNEFDNKIDPISEENSFIHSGTNIISSIWSDQPFVNKSSSQSNAGLIFSGKIINAFNDGMDEDQSDLCCKWKMFLTKEELLQNEYNLFDWNISSDPQIESLKSNNKVSQDAPEPCPNVFCSKIQTFPSFFSNINVKEQFCHLENFQDADYGNPKDENSCIVNLSPCSISHFNNSEDAIEDSVNNATRNFIALNHNREDSSFTEVLPRQTGGKKLFHDTSIENSCVNSKKQNEGVTDVPLSEGKVNVDGKEEEDLLTSARTHFRPIQLENQESHNNPTCCYADGTTFIISSKLSEVPYKRSESGTLYLENEDSGTPKKYLEYIDKRTEDQSKCAIISDVMENDGAFIPKFCVKQVEKCCQTDDSDLNLKKFKHDSADENWNFDLFPSGVEIVKNVENYLDEKSKISLEDNDISKNFEDNRNDDALYNEKNDSICKSLEAEMYVWNRAGCKCNNNNLFSSKSDSFKAFGGSFASEKGGLWEPTTATRQCQSRYSIWSGSPGPQTEPCPVCETLTQDKMVQHSQLREELSEDGEQLLSDLSSLEPLQLSAGWLDDALEQSGWGTEPNLLTRG